jgi:hypothetical protein
MITLLEATGFRSAAPRRFFDSFAGTSKERIARKFQVQGANFVAYK